MVEIADIIAPEGIILDLKGCNSKRQVLKELAQQAAALLGLDQQHLLDALMERERLGTTGIGHGIAIPHARLGEVARLAGLFARLDHPVDFESLDDLPSDLIFLLLAPDSADADSLKALARISRVLRDPGLRQRLRQETGPRRGLPDADPEAGVPCRVSAQRAGRCHARCRPRDGRGERPPRSGCMPAASSSPAPASCCSVPRAAASPTWRCA